MLQLPSPVPYFPVLLRANISFLFCFNSRWTKRSLDLGWSKSHWKAFCKAYKATKSAKEIWMWRMHKEESTSSKPSLEKDKVQSLQHHPKKQKVLVGKQCMSPLLKTYYWVIFLENYGHSLGCRCGSLGDKCIKTVIFCTKRLNTLRHFRVLH